MKVFLLGASGLIGRNIATALVTRGHHVFGLARSETSAACVASLGVEPVRGDLADPELWADRADACDALIQASGTFTDDMADFETRLLNSLLTRMTAPGKRYLATGGIWLFPAAGSRPTREDDIMQPTPGFEWAPALLKRVQTAGGLVVHPAAVWSFRGDLLERFLDPVRLNKVSITVAGGPQVRWPLIEVQDLADLYILVLEQGEPGQSYLAVAEAGTTQEELAQAVERGLGRKFARRSLNEADLIATEGTVAAGYARDLWVDGSEAHRAFNWQPRSTSAARQLARLARECRPDLAETDPGSSPR